MRQFRKWIGGVLSGLLAAGLLAVPAFAEAEDVRVIESGRAYAEADFEDGSLGGFEVESGSPEVTAEGGGSILSYQQTAASERLSMTYTFPQQLTGLVAIEARIKTDGNTPYRELFTLEDESGKSLGALYLDGGYFRLADTVGGYNFAIAKYAANKWDTVRMVIDFDTASGNPAVWYFVNGTQVKKHIVNPNEVPSTLKAKLQGLKKITTGTAVGTGGTWLDDIRVFPCQLVNFPALRLTGSTPEDGALEAPEDQVIRLMFNNPIPEEMCTKDHFSLRSDAGEAELAQILLEDEGRTVRLLPSEELAFQTAYTVIIRDLLDIHGLEQDRLSGTVTFQTQAGSLKAADFAVLQGGEDISGEGLRPGALTGRVEVRNYSPSGDATARLVLGIYQKSGGLAFLRQVASSQKVTVKQGEKQTVQAVITAPEAVQENGGEYYLEFHLIRDLEDLRPIGKSVRFGAGGFLD